MKKTQDNTYYTLACPRLALASILRLVILGGFVITFLIVSSVIMEHYLDLYLVIIAIFLVLFRIFSFWKSSVLKSFILVKFDKNGISNRYCSVRWNDVNVIKIDDLHEPNPTLLKDYNFGILYFIQTNQQEISESFLNYDVRDTIFFPCNDKVCELLRMTGVEKRQNNY